MNDYIGLVVSAPIAVVFIIMGLPLIYRKIKRNYFFGYRVSTYAMVDDDIWYEVNRLGGKFLVTIGCLLAVTSIFAAIFIYQPQAQDIILYFDLAIMFIGIPWSVIRGRLLNNQLARDKGLKNHVHHKDVYRLQ